MSDDSTEQTDLPARAEPETFRAREMTASLTADDLMETVAWYRDAVGFVVAREIERDGEVRAVAMVAGAVRIIINQDDGARGWDRSKGEGISLMLTTAQSVDDLAKRIVAAGGTLAAEPQDMPWGPRAFRVVDPNGIKLTIASA